MGQFLSFPRQYLSTVALMHNLHTGYMSPQYQVVFDDKFKTVFHDGKSSEELDNICDELFANSCDCYVEEYDDDGMLIYKPPPPDEVWLSEPERHERRQELEQQHTQAARQIDLEMHEVKHCLEKLRDLLLDLEESNFESDDESQSLLRDIDSGGDGCPDFWSPEEIFLPEVSDQVQDPLLSLPVPPPSLIVVAPGLLTTTASEEAPPAQMPEEAVDDGLE
ncbi:hypothetical protein ACHAW6_010772 [Cyclotella cf. meneghiniana]